MYYVLGQNERNHGPLARYVKLRVAHAPGMPETFFPPPRVSNPDMHHGTCVTHVPWGMPGSLTSGSLRSRCFPGIPCPCASHNFTYRVRGPWCYLHLHCPMYLFPQFPPRLPTTSHAAIAAGRRYPLPVGSSTFTARRACALPRRQSPDVRQPIAKVGTSSTCGQRRQPPAWQPRAGSGHQQWTSTLPPSHRYQPGFMARK